jgi:hypothetical protein
MMRGTDQMRRKITQGIRNEPPPFCATILEKRQIFPVPTAIPIVAIMRAQRDEKNSCPEVFLFSSFIIQLPDNYLNLKNYESKKDIR